MIKSAHWVLCVAASLLLSACATSGGGKIGDRTVQNSIQSVIEKTGLTKNSEQIESLALSGYGSTINDAIKKGKLLPNKDKRVIRLRKIADRVVTSGQLEGWNPRAKNWEWEVNLINSPEVNAFCMPGGKIVFFTGLLEAMQPSDDEIAIVMGHEIAHALREHSKDQLLKSQLTGALVNGGSVSIAPGKIITGLIKGGDIKPAFSASTNKGTDIGKFLTDFMNLSFSRGDETDADLVGLNIASHAGFNPAAGISFWEKMVARKSKSAKSAWLSTHPAGEDRVKEMQLYQDEARRFYLAACQANLCSGTTSSSGARKENPDKAIKATDSTPPPTPLAAPAAATPAVAAGNVPAPPVAQASVPAPTAISRQPVQPIQTPAPQPTQSSELSATGVTATGMPVPQLISPK